MNIFFFVPARAGSKGIPEKNLTNLAGAPLISFCLMAIRKALKNLKEHNAKIFVSTDSEAIAKVARNWKAEVPFLRPKKLAQDNSNIIDSIFYSVEELKKRKIFNPEIVFLIQPTSPIIEAKNILEAFDLFLKRKKPVISIAKIDIPLMWIFNLKNNRLVLDEKVKHLRQNQKEKYYRPNGAIYISDLKNLKKNKSFYSKETLGYIMDYYQSVDIDYPEDLEVAYKMLQLRRNLNLKEIKLGNKKIGKDNQVFFIAEAGVNHNGSLELAKKMVDVAKEAGADCVKFQTFKAKNLVSKDAMKADYQLKITPSDESQFEMLKKLELKDEDFKELKEYCDKKNIIFLSTPFDLESLELLKKLNVEGFKIGSGDLTNYFLIKEIAKTKKPIILSTGMAHLYEIFDAIELIEKNGNTEIAILHCLTEYPALLEELNLNAMVNMELIFNYPVGLSDHTEGDIASLSAALLDASIIEKHFTLDKNLPGPDHKASLELEELKKLIKNIRKIREIKGDGIKKPAKSEEKNRRIVRRSLFAKCEIKKGEKIEEDMLYALRPAEGISPMGIYNILGKRTKKQIKINEMINAKDLEEEK